ncbi:hypothetical protein EVAR_84084_1 [Eumeta japonica]|uniref:Uncharacterized protein n=1 Tax=Eumeta variegata TaxID=151549 RepID=A0A4C1UYU9_EUMVA|nr:hypothetical protein EVAR_84084_1 [Eumeta japonica]
MPSTRDYLMDATSYVQEFFRHILHIFGDRREFWVPMKDVIPDVPGCAGGSSGNCFAESGVDRVRMGRRGRRLAPRTSSLAVYFVECAFIPKVHFALFTDHAAKA